MARGSRQIVVQFLGDTKDFDRATKDVQAKTGAIGGTVKKFGPAVAAGFAVAGAAAIKFGVDAIGSASDLNETLNKSEVIFGSNSKAMERWADKAAQTMGLSKQAALESAAGFGDMFSQIGFTGDQAAKMSKQVVQMSADFGSFNNLPTAEVNDMIAASFRGEYDSLQRVIPNINAARVQQEALNMTHKKSVKDLTAAEKAQATLSIIQKDGARAAGDFAKTSDGLANSQKRLGAQFEDVKAKIGTKLLPVAAKLTDWMASDGIPLVEKFGKWFQEKLAPPIRDAAEKIMPKLASAWTSVKKSVQDAQPFLTLVGKVITNVLLPAMTKVASVVIPFWVRNLGYAAKALGKLGEAGIYMWNHVLQPVFKFFTQAIAKVLGGLSNMFGALSHVPKMGWAKGVAQDLRAAATEADALAAGINKIPNHKTVKFTLQLDARQRFLLNNPGETTLADIMYPKRAKGGRVQAGQVYQINELGMELFKPDSNGTVIPAERSAQIMRQGSSGQGSSTVRHILDLRLNGRMIREILLSDKETRGINLGLT